MACAFCRPVNFLCYWGPQPAARWKRPVGLVISVFFAFGVPAILMLATFEDSPSGVFGYAAAYLLFATIWAFAMFGIAVAVFACDDCVARMMGPPYFG